MKKQIILKVLIISNIFSVSLFAGSLNSTQIEEMVAAIKKERQGIALSELESTANPFIIKVPKEKEPTKTKASVAAPVAAEIVYTLKAVLNKAAFINKKWYKKGDKLGEYRVGKISSSKVILKSKNGNRTLSLKKKKKSFIKLNRGNK